MHEEAKAFRRAVQSHQLLRAGKAIRYGHELRRVAVDFVRSARAEGVSLLQCSRLLGVGYKSLHRWARAETGATAMSLRPVEIAAGAEESGGDDRLVLVTPGGFRIEGFARPDLALLLRLLP
jgi:hypothetical protein